MMKHHKVTLTRYIQHRLGQGDDLQLIAVMFRRSFGASSFTAFWQYWNPVYGYYLSRLCYRPLRAVLPRVFSVIATFATCGFLLHDLPCGWGIGFAVAHRVPFPFVTTWFAMIGIIVILAETIHMDLKALSFGARIVVNAMHVVVPFVITMVLAYTVY